MRRVVGLRTAALWTACLLGGLLAGQARAENGGQADLDKATQLKMTAASLADLNEVIRLCEMPRIAASIRRTGSSPRTCWPRRCWSGARP